jgi:transcriptional regulator with XRE-family HTH domain
MPRQYPCRMIDPDSLKTARKAAGLSQAALAKTVGVAQQLIGQLERGEVRTTKLIFRIAEALGVSASSLDNEIPVQSSSRRSIPVVGYVGAGAEVLAIDDHEKGGGLDEIDPPFQGLSPSTVAVRVRGNSMSPTFRDGEILLYDRQDNGDLTHLIGKDCVVSLADGRKFVKQIRRTPLGEWFLYSVNSDSDPIFGAIIEWAARVKIVLKN